VGKIVIAVYRPKPGSETALLELVKDHISLLRSESLVTDREPTAMQAQDGTLIEVFEWKSKDALEMAHTNKSVLAMWERFADVCEFLPISQVEDASSLLSESAPVDLGAGT